MKVKVIIALIMLALIVIFSLQNAEVTEVNFLFWTIATSRVLIILGSFAIGLLCGILLPFGSKLMK